MVERFLVTHPLQEQERSHSGPNEGLQASCFLQAAGCPTRLRWHDGMPPGELCRAMQELHECLAPVVEGGDEFDLQMLNMAERKPETPTSAERALSLTSKLEEAAP